MGAEGERRIREKGEENEEENERAGIWEREDEQKN